MNAWLVKGDDPTLVADAVRSLVQELTAGDPSAVEEHSGEEVDASAIAEACQTPPFLAERRVVVAREVGRFKTEELIPLLEWLADPLPTTALVLTAGGGQVSQKLVNAVKKVGTVVEAGAGRGRARTQWLADRLREAPVRLDRQATEQLGAHLGEDVGRLATLLDALAVAYGEGATVGTEELAPFLGQAGGVAPWDLTDAIDRGREGTAEAISQLHRLLGAGERHALVVLATLHRHYGAMLRLDGANVGDENEAAALLGTAPYPAKKAMVQARRLGSAKIAQAIEWLAEADVDLRGAKGWPDNLVLEVLVARLSRLTAGTGAGSGARRR
ncbi:MAG TPA: DNA polymerase III subunit delta [Acidimicrobiales bacterium]|nr:DNA polymerase III subunit delta [Acidimicrobiales bacterium]